MRYPGGKGKCYQHIINLLPPHSTYIETHLGGGAVLRHKKPACRSIGIDRDPAVIRSWQCLFPSLASYVEADAADFLASQSIAEDEVIYCDPPYLPDTRRRSRVYRYDYLEADHVRLLELLRKLPCRVVVSGYHSELYDECLCGWNTQTFMAKAHDGVRKEKLWFNFDVPDWLHDSRHLGHNFRERQTIKRRVQRLQRRIATLSPQEKHLVSEWLNDLLQDGGSDSSGHESARTTGLDDRRDDEVSRG
jgi:DNA adenine methylase